MLQIIDPWIAVEDYDSTQIMKNLERACRTCYRSEDKITEDSYKKLLTNCITRGHESILEHEKVTIRMCCDVGVYKDLTRHRHASFSIESTRYCNYSKGKFGSGVKVIKPCNIDEKSDLYREWLRAMDWVDIYYTSMSTQGATPDQMRMILPHSTAAEVVMTANIREWKHILNLRCSKYTHPAVRQVLIPLLLKFKEDMPEIFADIPYDEEFPKEKYAKLN